MQLKLQKFHVDGMHIHKPKWCGSHLKIKAVILASVEKGHLRDAIFIDLEVFFSRNPRITRLHLAYLSLGYEPK